MWIKNNKTGLIWEVVEKSKIEALLKDPDYTESRKSTATKTTKED